MDLLKVMFAGKNFILSFFLSFAVGLLDRHLRHSLKVAVNSLNLFVVPNSVQMLHFNNLKMRILCSVTNNV